MQIKNIHYLSFINDVQPTRNECSHLYVIADIAVFKLNRKYTQRIYTWIIVDQPLDRKIGIYWKRKCTRNRTHIYSRLLCVISLLFRDV